MGFLLLLRTKPATDSNVRPAPYSDLRPAGSDLMAAAGGLISQIVMDGVPRSVKKELPRDFARGSGARPGD